MSRPHLHDTGEGPAVLFLHAYPLDASQWDHQVAALSDRHRCLRADFYGCGTSPPPAPGVSLEGYARALLDALEMAGVDRFSTVGLSMGGYVSFALLRVAPERVASLVLADTRAGADTDEARSRRLTAAQRLRAEGVEHIVESTVEGLLGPRSRDEPHVTDPVRARVRRCTPEGLAAAQEAMAGRPDATALLPSIAVPAMVVAGADDATSPPDMARAMAAAIPDARLEIIDGAGHLSNLERPHAFNALLSDFLGAASS